jgi:hypothetical protein
VGGGRCPPISIIVAISPWKSFRRYAILAPAMSQSQHR